MVCCGRCKGVMQRIKGLPPGYGGANCDRCGAHSIHNREFLYHCRPCGWDLCDDCVNKEEAAWREKKLANAFKFDLAEEDEKAKLALQKQNKIEVK